MSQLAEGKVRAMTFAVICLLTLVRAGAVAVLTHWIARPLCEWTKSGDGRWQSIAMLIAFGLLAIPPLSASYVYANVALDMIRFPWFSELLYLALLLARSVPIYVLGYSISPPSPLTDAANHVLRMQPAVPRYWTMNALRAGCFHREIFLMFLIGWNVFHDFEIASFLLRPTWTVGIFDAHAGGLGIQYSLIKMKLPLLVSGCIALCAGIALFNARRLGAPSGESVRSTRHGPRALNCCVVFSLAGLYAIYPFARLLVESREVLITSILQAGLWQEIVTGIGVAALAAAGAYIAALTMLSASVSRGVQSAIAVLTLCGMAGSLIVSLFLLSVLQSNVLYPLLETHLPWITGLAISLLPKALLIAGVVVGMVPPVANHCVQMLAESEHGEVRRKARGLAWNLNGRRHFAAGVLLAYLGYLDLTSAAVLAPSRCVPAPVRLYNLMHYGHSAKLAAMLFWAFVIPLLVAILCYGAAALRFRTPIAPTRFVTSSRASSDRQV
ncbi:MAG: hypothetical protein O2931_10500 [Planctomycetota bacterium]|nr:hypothetical protein [Planctomycetota bacterium]MDA1179212.1 hypothetical protein [Planctomycetota bacterium]